jgi:hypothetical protein
MLAPGARACPPGTAYPASSVNPANRVLPGATQVRMRAAAHATFGLLNSTPHSAGELEPAAMAEMLLTMAHAGLIGLAAAEA